MAMFPTAIFFARALAVGSLLFDYKLLARISIYFACSYQLMGLHYLLLFIFFESFFALVRCQLTVRSALWELVGILTSSASCAARARPFAALASCRLISISLEKLATLFPTCCKVVARSLCTINCVFILTAVVLSAATRKLSHWCK